MRKKPRIKALMECEIEFQTIDKINHVSPQLKYIDAETDPVRIAMDIVDGSNFLVDDTGTVYPMSAIICVDCHKIRNFAAMVSENKDAYDPDEVQVI